MSKQADGEAKQDLPRLLRAILADLESALNNARNKPAKKLLQERIDRLRSAIDVLAASDQPARSTADNRTSVRHLIAREGLSRGRVCAENSLREQLKPRRSRQKTAEIGTPAGQFGVAIRARKAHAAPHVQL